MKLDLQNRAPKVEVLPDERLRVTRIFDVLEYLPKDEAKFLAQVKKAWGTVDEEYSDCRLIHQDMADPSLKPSVDRHLYVMVFEELSESGETQVGNNTQIELEDGRNAIEQEFVKFSAAGYTPGNAGASGGPGGTYLSKEEAPDDGTLIQIKRTWVAAGLLAQNDQTKNNGKLLIRTLTYAVTVPATPSGYILTGTPVQNPNGSPVYTYTFAKGEGEIDRDIDYSQSVDQGTTGVSRIVVVYLSDPSVSTDPVSVPGGFVKCGQKMSEEDGYRLWRITFGKGAGLVISEVDISKSGVLVIYHCVALGTAPTAPSATIAGTVTLFESSTRNDSGYIVYDYRWVEAKGRASLNVRSREDGSFVYSITDLGATSATPAYPGSGTGKLVETDNEPGPGYFINRAIYIKLPATRTIKAPFDWHKPGIASFSGTVLTLSGNVTIPLQADFEISYSDTRDDTDWFKVTAWASFNENYTISANGNVVTNQHALVGYLAESSSTTGTDDVYKGVLCDDWSGVLVSSIPSTRPTGDTILHVRNEEYLTDLATGDIIYRITKVSFTF